MSNWKKYLAWFGWFIGFVLLSADRLSNMIGKSTTPEDAQSLLEKVGKFLDWLTVHDSVWVLFIGVGLLAVSSALIYADIRNWLATTAAAPAVSAKQSQQEDELNRFHKAKITQTDPPPFSPARIYIAQMHVEAPQLRTDLYFNVVIRAINSSGAPIKISSLSGLIDCKDGAKPDVILDPLLNSPHLLMDRMAETVPDHSDFLIIFEQRATSKAAVLIADTIESEKGLRINFERLKIEAKRVGADESFIVPIWPEITVRKSDTILQVGRVIFASAHAKLFARDKVG